MLERVGIELAWLAFDSASRLAIHPHPDRFQLESVLGEALHETREHLFHLRGHSAVARSEVERAVAQPPHPTLGAELGRHALAQYRLQRAQGPRARERFAERGVKIEVCPMHDVARRCAGPKRETSGCLRLQPLWYDQRLRPGKRLQPLA
jgi:hypothetical protein